MNHLMGGGIVYDPPEPHQTLLSLRGELAGDVDQALCYTLHSFIIRNIPLPSATPPSPPTHPAPLAARYPASLFEK